MGLLALIGPTQGVVEVQPPPPGTITISLLTAPPISVPANSAAGTHIAQLQLNEEATGQGVWTKTGFAKSRLAESPGGSIVAPINGTTIFIDVSQQLVAGDAVDSTNVTVTYTGEGQETPATLTVTFSVVAVTQQSFATAPATAFAVNWQPLPGAGTITPGADGVVIEAAVGGGNAADTITWASGFCTNNDTGDAAITSQNRVATWRGRPIKARMVYLGWNALDAKWSEKKTNLNGTTSLLQHCAANGIVPMIDTPTCDSTCHGEFDKITNNTGGTYHADIRAYGDSIKLIFGTDKPCIILMCRECNHTDELGYHWFAGLDLTTGVKTKFINAYKKVVDLLKEVGRLNTTNYKFLLSLQKDPKPGLEIDKLYPGDAYADYIGVNWYDAGPIAQAGNYDNWKLQWTNKFLTYAANRPGGPRGICMPEWGARHLTNDPQGGCDNPNFVKHMKRLMGELGASMIAESYFRIDRFFDVPPAGTSAIHSICYNSGGTVVSGTPFNGASPGAGGTNGAFVGSVAGTSVMSAQYIADFGGAVAGVAGGDATHAQIVSFLSLTTDFVMVVDITVLDNAIGTDTQEAGLIYFQMKGDGTVGHPTDLTNFTGATGSTRFELDATGYRMSFDPLDPNGNNEDQIRMRLCDAGDLTLPIIIGTGDGNNSPGDFPFVTGKKYRCTIGKLGTDFSFKYQDLTTTPTPAERIFPLKTDDQLALYTSGQFIFRCMEGRKIKFNVQSVTEQTFVDPGDGDGGGDGGGGAEFPFDIAAVAPANKHTVTTEQGFKDAIANPNWGAGHVITVNQNPGERWASTFNFDKVIPLNGPPVIYKADINQGVTISGEMNFGATSQNQMLWGFKMVGDGTSPHILMAHRGKKNRVQRFDFQGWGKNVACSITNGDGGMLYYCSFHDPAEYTPAELATKNTVTMCDRYGFRLQNNVAGFHINFRALGIVFYNFPDKIDSPRYGSGQTDGMEHGGDVTQTVTAGAPFESGGRFERILVEASHMEFMLNDSNIAANMDIKAGGSWWKNVTLLALGRFDIRGNCKNILEDFYMEATKGVWISGGDNTIKNVKGVAGTQPGIGNVTPEVKITCGNVEPNKPTAGTYQRAVGTIVEDVRGCTVTVGQTVSNWTLKAKNTTVRRCTNVVLAQHEGTTVVTGAPTGTAPTKLTRGKIVGGVPEGDCGHLAPWVAPTIFTA